VEQGLSPDTTRLLEGKGHRVVVTAAMGSANSVEVLAQGGSLGVADPRRLDAAAMGELQLRRPVEAEP
jgi:gamma-glutamyltranspeptidase/glutathione hydrolase